MLEWFSRWTPEHVIGFVTAIGIVISAWKFKGKAKTGEATPPTVDVEGMIHNVRLAPADREKIEDLQDSMTNLRRAGNFMESELLQIKTAISEVATVARKLEASVGKLRVKTEALTDAIHPEN